MIVKIGKLSINRANKASKKFPLLERAQFSNMPKLEFDHGMALYWGKLPWY